MISEVKRCEFDMCNKRLTYIDLSIICKCGGMFCEKHRCIIDHQCSYDYRSEHKINLKNSNYKIIGNKIVKI